MCRGARLSVAQESFVVPSSGVWTKPSMRPCWTLPRTSISFGRIVCCTTRCGGPSVVSCVSARHVPCASQDDSEYYKQANRMRKLFSDKVTPLLGAGTCGAIECNTCGFHGCGPVAFQAKPLKTHGQLDVLLGDCDIYDTAPFRRVPTQAEKKAFSQAIYVISPEELGKVVKILDDRCSQCIRKVGAMWEAPLGFVLLCTFACCLLVATGPQIDPDDIEIDIDQIDPATFWVADKFVKECAMPGGSSMAPSSSKAPKKRARDDPPVTSALKRA